MKCNKCWIKIYYSWDNSNICQGCLNYYMDNLKQDEINWKILKGSSEDFDIVNHPSHYKSRGGIEPLEFTVSNNMNFLEWSIIKYIYRYKDKWGVESLKKAEFYLKRLIVEQWKTET